MTERERKLAEALMGMVEQHFMTEKDESLSHSFMGADEQAIDVLLEFGLAEEARPGRPFYRLLWDKLVAAG